ncbi:MAG: TetR/AcrR family transcriptional regulator [Anderseniella sp.]|jgi:AcrR family transcriptional regulator|nr:TetR/AcrR family transcriptional regulator [Anderseniella sp.]
MNRKRNYTLRKRAESQEETRQRIVEAAMHLHEELGPRATTISAIADRAGVQRLTVYRHFPDENAIFAACTAHWSYLNPPPGAAAWTDLADPAERARTALEAYYRYYRGVERMLSASHLDAPFVPALQEPVQKMQHALSQVADDIVTAFPGTAQPGLEATVHHAFAFTTWVSLKAQGLNDTEMASLVTTWIVSASQAGGRPADR